MITIVGLYLFFTETVASGYVTPGKLSGYSGTSVALNGKSAIIFGLAICLFPVYQLIVQRKKR
ncbi:hypothetical protein [Ferruginibacter profundus]